MVASMFVQTAPVLPTDADLVAASRRGDREAFGRIVRRYQSMVTGVLYAACGDLHRSEDLAQDTFISAWRSLSGLREPAKLPAWLCQVARHRLLDDARGESRRDARLARAFQNHGEPTAPPADQQVLTDEERDLLWRTLREVAQPYRETMVLYYRQGKSVADVALAMDASEANVRQRLARGREMLREQVAGMLERNLARSAPGAAFATAVVAALPALIPQTAAASAFGAAAVKGTAATAKGGGLLAAAALWVGPLVGVLGGALGSWCSIRSTQHPRERRFVVRLVVEVWVLVCVQIAILLAIAHAQERFGWQGRTNLLVQTGVWLAYTAVLITLVIVRTRQHRRLRGSLGLTPTSKTGPQFQPRMMPIVFGGATVGAMSWMFALAARANDQLGLIVIIATTAILVAACIRFTRGRTPAQLRRFAMGHAVALSAANFVAVNVRLHTWVAGMTDTPLAGVRERLPLWAVNVFTAVLCACVIATVWVSMRQQQPLTAATTPPAET